MKRILGQAFAVGITTFVAAAAMPACADNDMSIYVENVLAPPANRQNGQCIYTPDPQSTAQLEGLMDLGIRDNYVAVLLVGNQMIPRGDPAQTRAESNRVHINGAVVKVTETDGTLIHEFTSTGAGLAQPQNNNVPGYDLALVTAIDSQARQNIIAGSAARGFPRVVISTIRVFGRTLGGSDLESGDFQFPIRVCDGCLVDFSTGTDLAQPLPNCAAALQTGAGGGGGQQIIPCFAGQDESTPCQLCRSRPACTPR